MKEEQLKQILLFFFFVTLNEQRTKELAQKSWFWCLDKKKHNPNMNSEHIVLLSLHKIWKDLQKEPRTGLTSFSEEAGWMIPPNIRLEPWKEFQKTASSEEIFITVVALILKFSESILTDVLGLSSGTIRYRLAKTSRKIGISVDLHQGVQI